MATGSGLDAQLGLAAETTYGTYTVPSRFIEFTSESLKRQKATIQGGGLRAGGQYERSSRRAITTRHGKGALAFDFTTTGMGLLLKAATGNSTITAGSSTTASAAVVPGTSITLTAVPVVGQVLGVDVAGAYEQVTVTAVAGNVATVTPALAQAHATGVAVTINGGPTVFTQIHTPGSLRGNSLSAQVGRPTAGSAVEPFTYIGCKVEDLDISVAKNGLAVMTAALLARDELTLGGQGSPVGPALATASYAAGAQVFSFLGGGLTLNGVSVAACEKASFKLTNPYKADRFYLSAGGLMAEPLTNAWRKISGSLETEFVDRTTVYDLYAADANVGVGLSFIGTTPIAGTQYLPTLNINVPGGKLDGEAPSVGGPDVLKLVAPYVGLAPAAGGAEYTVTLASADTTF